MVSSMPRPLPTPIVYSYPCKMSRLKWVRRNYAPGRSIALMGICMIYASVMGFKPLVRDQRRYGRPGMDWQWIKECGTEDRDIEVLDNIASYSL